jgi:uncharacterized protein
MSWHRSKRGALGVSGALALVVLFLAAWGFWWEPASLRTVETELVLPGWPASCDGLRVAVVSDLHVGSPWNGLANLDRVVAQVAAARPGLVLFAGDFVIRRVRGGTFVPPEDIAERLARVEAPLGRYAVLGNHDWWFDGLRVLRALEAHGITVLEDRSVALPDHGCALWLAGVSDLWERLHDVNRALAGVPDGAPVLLLTHNPDLFPTVPARVALTIAGHTHGGQVFLPLLGRPIVPSQYGQRYAIGHVIEGGRHLFVSPGIGTSIIPVRFRVPPEISLLVLRGARE